MTDRNVLVTGGTGGIGQAIVAAYRQAGDRVAVTFHGEAQTAHAIVGAEGVAVRMDLDAPETIEPAVAATIDALGGLDTLVVNAVRWPREQAARFEDLSPAEWTGNLRANLEGALWTVRAALPALRRSAAGRIVLVSSGIAEEGVPMGWAYAAAKAGLHGFARTLAWDAGRDGVLVNVVVTGFTRTPRNERHFPAELFEQVGAGVPLGHVSGPEDVAGLIAWLGSAANTSVTGEMVREGTSSARSALGVMVQPTVRDAAS
jgi:NAD(P)-dependent dehydrogenase (short-subunit alcohol dehydrogenase family)